MIHRTATVLRTLASPELALAAALPIVVIGAACGVTRKSAPSYSNGGSPTAATLMPLGMSMVGAADMPPGPAVTNNQVSIQNFSFGPGIIDVSVGTTVTWTNNDSVTHTVTAADGSFDSSTLAPGQRFSTSFTTPGTYIYHCSIHPFMTGQVVVQ